jgi:hypothetical protein
VFHQPFASKNSQRSSKRTGGGASPGRRVVNNIRGSFFDDPNHVSADKTK